MPIITIDDYNYHKFIEPVVDGEGRKTGLLPRDFAAAPVGYFAEAKPFPSSLLIPRSEWKNRLAMQKASKSRLIDIRNHGNNGEPIPARDQNGKGYCWFHSSTSAMLLTRAVQGEPYVDLSAYAGACIIKNYKDQGGYGAQSLKFIAERGVPTSEFWPQQSMSRANDNSKTWENAALHKFTEWYDLESRNLDQFVTCCLLGYPIVSDFNWWGHSVCTMCLEEVGNTVGELKSWILNSWGDKWSENGAGMLKGSKALPDSMQAARVGTPSTK